MLDNRFAPQERPLLIRNATPIGFVGALPPRVDVLVSREGAILEAGPRIETSEDPRVLDVAGAYLCAGWTDLHAHVYWGGTDISIEPAQCGAERGVTTIVDAGSAGEANFAGMRRFVIEPARENVYAFLNLGSIGLVACNRVSELMDMRSIDIDRTLDVVRRNADAIVGIKVRASAVITGGWDLVPVKLGKKLSRILKLPVMVHVGEPPPLYDEILGLLEEGDIVTHCFNGKQGGSLLEDEELYRLVEDAAARGIVLDVGHGGASFSFDVGAAALARGLKPTTISTDLHNRSMDGAVWDLATTMSKLHALGMRLEDVVEAVTRAPRRAIRRPGCERLAPGEKAELTVFDVVDGDLEVVDSHGARSRLSRIFEPRYAVLGAEAISARRHRPESGGRHSCPHCGWLS